MKELDRTAVSNHPAVLWINCQLNLRSLFKLWTFFYILQIIDYIYADKAANSACWLMKQSFKLRWSFMPSTQASKT